MYGCMHKDKIERIRSTVKRVSAPTTPKPEKRRRSTKVSPPAQADVNQQGPCYSDEETMTTSTEPPRKQPKQLHLEPKAGAAKGCQETHFWSNNGFFVQNANRTSVSNTRIFYANINAKTSFFTPHHLCLMLRRKIKRTIFFKIGNTRVKEVTLGK